MQSEYLGQPYDPAHPPLIDPARPYDDFYEDGQTAINNAPRSSLVYARVVFESTNGNDCGQYQRCERTSPNVEKAHEMARVYCGARPYESHSFTADGAEVTPD